MRINSTDKTYFGAIPVSKAKVCARGLNENYTIYELMHSDKKFLKDLYSTLDLQSLMPGLKADEYISWNNILRVSMTSSICECNRGILLADKNNVPCGILNYKPLTTKLEVKRVATWPVNKSERKLMAGKTLFMEIFQRIADDEQKLLAYLEALRLSAFSPISRYMELGFKMCGGDNVCESMSIRRENVIKALDKYKDSICIEKIQNRQNVDLYETLVINNKSTQ